MLSYVIPQKWKLKYLLIVNIVFYLLCGWQMLGFLFGVILITYFGGKENVLDVKKNMSRVNVIVKDPSVVDKDGIINN